MSDELLDQSEVAEICKISPKTVANWVAGANEAFPKGFKLGDGPRAPRRWWKSTISEFLATQAQKVA